MSQGWRTIAEAKKAAQQTAIPKEWVLPNTPSQDVLDIMHVPETCGLLSQAELTITNSNVDILLARLASGEWSSVSVTSAFYKRAIIAHQLTNCLTEIFVDRALTRAAELDRRLKETGRTVGPLHGLPVSLKDQINIQGLESCMGYVSWVGQYAERNAVLVDILENAGAVPFVKTNIPQTLMWPETFNHVFGRTVNPHNRSLTSGGSSGGEGALVALKGSPIGVGSDIGGSIRIPSGFCGLYGLRPSYGRVPYAGCVNSLEGQDSVLSVLGPLSNSISGVKNFLKAVIDAKPWLKDPLAVRKRWSDDEYNLADHGFGKKLCFAILWDDGLIRPHPPILRGLEMVKRALQVAGHQVIDWKAHRHEEMCACMRGIWGSGAEEDYRVVTAVTGEPVISSMGLEEDGVASDTDFRPTEGISAYQLWQIQRKKRDLRQEYLNQWEATVTGTGTGRPIDAIISPVAPYAAPPHGMNKGANYTMVWNLLDYSALVIPVSKVDEQVDVQRPPHKFHSDVDQANYQFYDPKTFKNAPICVQVVGRTLEEEAVIAMSEIIDEALKAAPAIAEL